MGPVLTTHDTSISQTYWVMTRGARLCSLYAGKNKKPSSRIYRSARKISPLLPFTHFCRMAFLFHQEKMRVFIIALDKAQISYVSSNYFH